MVRGGFEVYGVVSGPEKPPLRFEIGAQPKAAQEFAQYFAPQMTMRTHAKGRPLPRLT